MGKFGLWASLESWSQMALNGTLINIEVKNMNWTSHSWLLLWRTFEYTIQSRFTKWIQRLDGGWTYALDLSVGLKALMGSWVHWHIFWFWVAWELAQEQIPTQIWSGHSIFFGNTSMFYSISETFYFILNWSRILSELKRVTTVDHLVCARLYKINSIWQYIESISKN